MLARNHTRSQAQVATRVPLAFPALDSQVPDSSLKKPEGSIPNSEGAVATNIPLAFPTPDAQVPGSNLDKPEASLPNSEGAVPTTESVEERWLGVPEADCQDCGQFFNFDLLERGRSLEFFQGMAMMDIESLSKDLAMHVVPENTTSSAQHSEALAPTDKQSIGLQSLFKCIWARDLMFQQAKWSTMSAPDQMAEMEAWIGEMIQASKLQDI